MLNNLIKIISGAGAIAQTTTKNVAKHSQNLLENNILLGKYVTREEFEVLKEEVESLRYLLLELQDKLNNKQ